MLLLQMVMNNMNTGSLESISQKVEWLVLSFVE